MFVFDDVAGDTHSQSGSLSDGLGGEEVLVESLFHFLTHAFAVVGKADDEVPVLHLDGDRYLRLVVVAGRLLLLPHRIACIVHHVEYGSAQVLRNDHHRRQAFLIVLVDGDVEVLEVGTQSMIRHPDVLFHDFADVGRQELVLLAARHHQDALNHADGAFAVLNNLGQVRL